MINIKLSPKIFNDVYFPLLTDYTHRTEVLYGGAGSGKSVFVAQKIIYRCLTDKRTVLVVRKTLVSQNRSCWKLLLDVLDKWQITKYCKINKSDYQITFPTGSIIYIAGIDNPERIKSIAGITDEWIEEATELTLDDYTQLQLRLRADVKGSQVYCSFNPVSKANWVYKMWFDTAPTDTTAKIVKTTYKDNKFLPDSYIEELEKMINTNPTYYRIYALGEFCTLDKLVYNNYKIEAFDTAINGDLICGLDFGYVNDPTAFIVGVVQEEEKKIYIIDEWYEKGKTNEEIAQAIKYKGYSKSLIIADSAEPKSIEELRRDGLYRIKDSVKGKDSILNGIQLLQQYQIIIHPKCINMQTEIQNYTWQKDKNTNEYINKPIDEYNHLLDALRYSMQCLGKGQLKSLKRGIL